MGEASMVLNWISLYVFLTGEAVEDVAVEFGVSDLESVEGGLLGSDDDFAAGVLMLSLLSSFPFSWGSGGNATARRCFLLLPGVVPLQALANPTGVSFTSDAPPLASSVPLPGLAGVLLFIPSSLPLSCDKSPSLLLPLIYGSSVVGRTGVPGAVNGASSCSEEFRNVRRKQPGRPRGC